MPGPRDKSVTYTQDFGIMREIQCFVLFVYSSTFEYLQYIPTIAADSI